VWRRGMRGGRSLDGKEGTHVDHQEGSCCSPGSPSPQFAGVKKYYLYISGHPVFFFEKIMVCSPLR
jgi:hypothetical protein